IEVEDKAVKAVIFNHTLEKNYLTPRKKVTLIGKWDAHRLQITEKTYKLGQPKSDTTIDPLYSLKGKLKMFQFKKIMKQAVDLYASKIEEIIPEHYLTDYKIANRADAIRAIHLPYNKLEIAHAKRWFPYDAS